MLLAVKFNIQKIDIFHEDAVKDQPIWGIVNLSNVGLGCSKCSTNLLKMGIEHLVNVFLTLHNLLVWKV